MKKYVNRSYHMATIKLADGTVQFLRRGESFVPKQEVVEAKGEDLQIIDVAEEKTEVKTEVKTTTRRKKTTSSEEEGK